MPKYIVTHHINSLFSKEVEADDEQEAKEIALQNPVNLTIGDWEQEKVFDSVKVEPEETVGCGVIWTDGYCEWFESENRARNHIDNLYGKLSWDDMCDYELVEDCTQAEFEEQTKDIPDRYKYFLTEEERKVVEKMREDKEKEENE